MNLCPSYRHLRAAKTETGSSAADDKDILYAEKYDLMDDERIAHLKAIRANTPLVVSIRMFICQNRKGQPENYCDELADSNAGKKICESNKTDYVFFYIDKSECNQTENKPRKESGYLLAFSRFSKKEEKTQQKIVLEVQRTAKWLGIDGSVIQCYVFYYTAKSQTNTFDMGTIKKEYAEQYCDPNYLFQIHYIAPSEKPLWLYVNGGSPRFTVEIQEE